MLKYKCKQIIYIYYTRFRFKVGFGLYDFLFFLHKQNKTYDIFIINRNIK